MDIIFFITLFSLVGIVTMLSYRGWELSRGTVVHSHPHAIDHLMKRIKKFVRICADKVVDVWFEYIAPHLAKAWIHGVRLFKWRVIRDAGLRVYGNIRGRKSVHVASNSNEASEFLQSVQAHKKEHEHSDIRRTSSVIMKMSTKRKKISHGDMDVVSLSDVLPEKEEHKELPM